MSLNWVDFIMIVIFFKVLYSARKNDFKIEIYYFFGALLTTFIALHYFTGFAVYLSKYILGPDMAQEIVAFTILALLTYFIFVVSRGGWSSLIDISMPSFLNKWGSISISILRSFLFCGLVYMALMMFHNGILAADVKSSATSPVFKRVSIATYSFLFESLVKPLKSSEKFNDRVYELVIGPKLKLRMPVK